MVEQKVLKRYNFAETCAMPVVVSAKVFSCFSKLRWQLLFTKELAKVKDEDV